MWTNLPDQFHVKFLSQSQRKGVVTVTVEVTGLTKGDEPECWLVPSVDSKGKPDARFRDPAPKITGKNTLTWKVAAKFKLKESDHGKKYVAAVGLLNESETRGKGGASQKFEIE
ncbi:MAG TPA: hypothetical protein VER11_10725 [Polyangiaceae bacterium]|nr:hypothetical protein [Polyangiaceae bacterium]